jgi:hypothetical protein
MSWLSLLLITKIGVTGLLVAAPFLLLSKSKLEKSTSITTPTSVFFRLYGVAITALLVGYAFGIPTAEDGRFPWGVVCMGTVSNGGAAILLLAYSQGNKQNRVLAAFFGLIALGLIAAMVLPASAIQKAW